MSGASLMAALARELPETVLLATVLLGAVLLGAVLLTAVVAARWAPARVAGRPELAGGVAPGPAAEIAGPGLEPPGADRPELMPFRGQPAAADDCVFRWLPGETARRAPA